MLLQQPDPFKVHGLQSPFLALLKQLCFRADTAQRASAESAFASPPRSGHLGEQGVCSWTEETEIMTQERLWQVLDPSWGDLRALSALLCSSAAAVVLLKWLGRRQIQQKMDEARRSRHLALERMEKAAHRLKQENPGTQTSHILSLTMVELAEKLKEGSLSPESVLYSYMDKALEVNREVNCVTDFIHGCEDQLQKLKKQKEKGLLYGIPISIKDHINCKGHISSGGMVKFLGQVKEEDSVIVQVLKHQGGIPFVKTNIPQTMINYDCSNPIFGQTLNPLNPQKSPGGSSGGEGALIAGGGSILGIGSDVAGSIRLPSSFCGLCGLKPTGNRISKQGVISPLIGMQSVTGMLGPMARDVDSLALCMKALLCQEMFQLDPTVPPIPFDEQVYTGSQPLRIGYYEGDGYFQPSPSMKRAVQHTRKLLQDAGHTQRRHRGSQPEIPVQYLQGSCSSEKDLGYHFETHIPTDCSGPQRSLWSGICQKPLGSAWSSGGLPHGIHRQMEGAKAGCDPVSRAGARLQPWLRWEALCCHVLHQSVQRVKLPRWGGAGQRGHKCRRRRTGALPGALRRPLGQEAERGCVRSCGDARGRAVRGPAVAGGAVPALHEGGGGSCPRHEEKCVISGSQPPVWWLFLPCPSLQPPST
ncbi:vitamin D3 hydroxylase-associated protein isoform X2 [Hirundo rustica]|uniref:vitamin D3 hydroxylase-associated protein isoform X2 n=1 Tax=Hirundo rustica TaxID=43150 RepID=UPI0026718975|nr:vitamin D3 hydroxylase-associated protein isoform X2 [Hirundo rustica]